MYRFYAICPNLMRFLCGKPESRSSVIEDVLQSKTYWRFENKWRNLSNRDSFELFAGQTCSSAVIQIVRRKNKQGTHLEGRPVTTCFNVLMLTFINGYTMPLLNS